MDNFNTLEIMQVWRTKRTIEAHVRVDGFNYDFLQNSGGLFSGAVEVRYRDLIPVRGYLDPNQATIYRARLVAFLSKHLTLLEDRAPWHVNGLAPGVRVEAPSVGATMLQARYARRLARPSRSVKSRS